MKAAALIALTPLLLLALSCGGGGASQVSLTLTPDLSRLSPDVQQDQALNEISDILKRRADLYGIENPRVTLEGQNFSVTLKGISRDSALDLTTDTGNLEFKRPYITREGLVVCKTLQGEQFGVPPDSVNPDDTSGSLARCFSLDKLGEPEWVAAEAPQDDGSTIPLTPDHVEPDGWQLRNDNTAIAVTFTPDGAALFQQLTDALTGYRLGLFLDGRLVAAPRIQRAVTDGTAVISGFQPEDAHVLAAVLNSGPLPLPLSQSTGGE